MNTTQTSYRRQYEQDYSLWLETTIERLRNKDFEAIDLENLLEELEDMGRSEKRSIRSLLTRLLEHLLKLIYWESERSRCERGWKAEINTFRNQIQKLLKDSPSLKPYLQEIYNECYLEAVETISLLTGVDISSSPLATLEQFPIANDLETVLDKTWFPSS